MRRTGFRGPHQLRTNICQQIRFLVPRDLEAAAIVTCWVDGFMERDEVLRLTGLSEATYESARNRLRYAIRSLPSDLCEAARDLLRDAA